MLPALLDDQRRWLQRVSLMLCTFAVATLTVVAPTSFAASAREIPASRLVMPARIEKLDYPPLDLRRDPFVPAAAYRAAVRNSSGVAGAGGTVIRAIVTGAEPRALIESNGSVRVVGIGDRIGSSAIIGIDARGVVIEGGLTLPIATDQP
jgi:hypothetical protein